MSDYYNMIKGKGYDNLLDVIDVSLFYLHYIGVVIELIFMYIMIKNWLCKNKKLYSSFFILFTVKAGMDTVITIYYIITTYTHNRRFYGVLADVDLNFILYTLNFDILCHCFISINRFTAIMTPTMYNTVSYFCKEIIIIEKH